MADKRTQTYLGARCRVARGRSRQGQAKAKTGRTVENEHCLLFTVNGG
jgi:hypothetical protein